VPQTPQSTVTLQYAAAQITGDLNVLGVGWNDTTGRVSLVTTPTAMFISWPSVQPLEMGHLKQSTMHRISIQVQTRLQSCLHLRPLIQTSEYSSTETERSDRRNGGRNREQRDQVLWTLTNKNANDLLFAANTVATSAQGPGTSWLAE
jgi:hypothetical protein